MGRAVLSVPLAPLWRACGHLHFIYLFIYLFINNIQNPYTAVCPIDIGMVKE
jgi:hypothetical protein